jgi:hypothetical protein
MTPQHPFQTATWQSINVTAVFQVPKWSIERPVQSYERPKLQWLTLCPFFTVGTETENVHAFYGHCHWLKTRLPPETGTQGTKHSSPLAMGPYALCRIRIEGTLDSPVGLVWKESPWAYRMGKEKRTHHIA